MTLRSLVASATFGFMLLLAACGSGSGRGGTDIRVTGLGPSDAVMSGDSAVFVMTVSNVGENPASDVQIVNLVGNQLAMVGIACTAGGDATCPDPVGASMSVSSLPVGGSLTFEVTARVQQAAVGAIVNTMTATYGDDVDRTNNSATAAGSATSHNVNVTAVEPDGPLVGGASATFTMVVGNSGPGTAVDVEIVNTLSDDLAAAGDIECVAADGAVAPASTADGSLRSPAIPPNGTLTCSVPVTVAAGTNGTVSSSLSASAAGDARNSDNIATATVSVTSSDLGVSQTGATEVPAGGAAVFTARVANPGPSAATNVVIEWSLTAPAGVTAAVPTCTATGGASCPATLGATMTVPSLPVGRALVFTFTAGTENAARGSIVSTVTVSADEDTNAANNSATSTAVAVDARNGTYLAFGADGKSYDLSIDFDAGRYTMSGDGRSVQRNFTEDATSGDHVVGGDARFRVAEDLLAGGHDFGDGVLPFIAARRFATSIGDLAGSYNLATRNVPASGVATTRAGTARVTGNVLQVCQSGSSVTPPQNCDDDALKSYALSVSGGVFTGVESTTGETYAFRLALSGASEVLLSAGTAADTSEQLRIGLRESAGLAGGTLRGASSTGEWVAVTLTDSSYEASGSITDDSAAIQRISNSTGPFSMLTGRRDSDQAQIYVMQAVPLAVVVGGFGGAPSASGLLQVLLP